MLRYYLRIGGFFFGLRAPELKTLEREPGILFDPGNILFGQENSLIEVFNKIGLKTALTKEVFVHHYKSITVRRSGYKVGHLTADNSNLKHYHFDDSRESHVAKMGAFRKNEVVAAASLVLSNAAVTVIAFTSTSAPTEMTKLANAVAQHLLWRVVSLQDKVDPYDLSGIDILVSSGLYELDRAIGAKANLAKVYIAPPFRSQAWDDKVSIGRYDLLLVQDQSDSDLVQKEEHYEVSCHVRCPDSVFASEMALSVESLGLGSSSAVLAKQFRHTLDKYSLLPNQAMRREEVCHDTTRRHQLCVVARTFAAGGHHIHSFLDGLMYQDIADMEPRVFFVNTDVDVEEGGVLFSEKLKNTVRESNLESGRCNAHVIELPFSPDPGSYGYDATDWAVETLLDAGGCSHFLITNGDNYYLPQFMEIISEKINAGYQFVAYDFLTHHQRDKTNVIEVDIKRKFIDLGSFVLSADVLRKSGASFMPEGPATSDVFARDWHFVKDVTKYLKARGEGNKISLVHQVLYSHQ
jgi:hypothetical protein